MWWATLTWSRANAWTWFWKPHGNYLDWLWFWLGAPHPHIHTHTRWQWPICCKAHRFLGRMSITSITRFSLPTPSGVHGSVCVCGIVGQEAIWLNIMSAQWRNGKAVFKLRASGCALDACNNNRVNSMLMIFAFRSSFVYINRMPYAAQQSPLELPGHRAKAKISEFAFMAPIKWKSYITSHALVCVCECVWVASLMVARLLIAYSPASNSTTFLRTHERTEETIVIITIVMWTRVYS